jgi:hypothetical protein
MGAPRKARQMPIDEAGIIAHSRGADRAVASMTQNSV